MHAQAVQGKTFFEKTSKEKKRQHGYLKKRTFFCKIFRLTIHCAIHTCVGLIKMPGSNGCQCVHNNLKISLNFILFICLCFLQKRKIRKISVLVESYLHSIKQVLYYTVLRFYFYLMPMVVSLC